MTRLGPLWSGALLFLVLPACDSESTPPRDDPGIAARAAFEAQEFESALSAFQTLLQEPGLDSERRIELRRWATLCAAALGRDAEFWDLVAEMENDPPDGTEAEDALILVEGLVETERLSHARMLLTETRRRVEEHPDPEQQAGLLERLRAAEEPVATEWESMALEFQRPSRQPISTVDWMPDAVRIEYGRVDHSAGEVETIFPWDPDGSSEKERQGCMAFRLPTGGLVLHIVPPAYWYEVVHLIVELDAVGPEGRVCGVVSHVMGDLVVPFAWQDSLHGSLRVDARADEVVAVHLDLRFGTEGWMRELKGAVELEPTDAERTWLVDRYLSDRLDSK